MKDYQPHVCLWKAFCIQPHRPDWCIERKKLLENLKVLGRDPANSDSIFARQVTPLLFLLGQLLTGRGNRNFV